jgi:hypothetical protein
MKPTFNKFVVFILSAFLCFGVSACGSSMELSDDPIEAAVQKAFGKSYDSVKVDSNGSDYEFTIIYEDLDDFDSFVDKAKKDTFDSFKNLAEYAENKEFSDVNFDYRYRYTNGYGKETSVSIVYGWFDNFNISRIDFNNAKYQAIDETSDSWIEIQKNWPEYD